MKHKITISGTDILRSTVNLNQFNGNSMYSKEYHRVNDLLSNYKKTWNDIIDYEYTIGLALPKHLNDLPKSISTTVDGYEVLITFKDE